MLVLRRSAVFKLAVLLCLLLPNACAIQQREMNTLADSLELVGAQSTLLALENITPRLHNHAQYLLNRGRLKSIIGDIEGSSNDLQKAKTLMASYQAISVSENLTAISINDTLRTYTGTPSERVLVHLMLAYNYLRQGNLDSARVEMLQADVTMRELAKTNSLSAQLAGAHFTSGLIYELNNEIDSAMISYRRAAQIMDQRGQSLPPALEDSLLYISNRQGLKKEYANYVNRFSRKAHVFNAGGIELIIMYADGIVSSMNQQIVRGFSVKHNQFLSLAIPYYLPANYLSQPFTLNIAGQYYSTHILEDIERLVREDLTAKTPGIMATALMRAALKYNTVNNAEKQGDVAQALMNIASVMTETADMRSWNMLPSTLQIARIRLTQRLGKDVVAQAAGLSRKDVISFNEGETLLLVINSVK